MQRPACRLTWTAAAVAALLGGSTFAALAQNAPAPAAAASEPEGAEGKGQLQTITLPLFGLNETFLIDSVSAAQDADGELRYTVRALATGGGGEW